MRVMSLSRREFLSLTTGAALAGTAGLGAPRPALGSEG